MVFDGEYLNGKKNGKFKQYNNEDKLIYEGEYLNGKLNGKLNKYNHISLFGYIFKLVQKFEAYHYQYKI